MILSTIVAGLVPRFGAGPALGFYVIRIAFEQETEAMVVILNAVKNHKGEWFVSRGDTVS
jgi:hypothetical protein